MAWEPKEGSGSLFQADKKGNEKAPAYRGDILLNGVMYELAGWVKKTSKGDNFLSLAGKVKEERHTASMYATSKEVPKPAGGMADMSDEIPFNKLGKHAY